MATFAMHFAGSHWTPPSMSGCVTLTRILMYSIVCFDVLTVGLLESGEEPAPLVAVHAVNKFEGLIHEVRRGERGEGLLVLFLVVWLQFVVITLTDVSQGTMAPLRLTVAGALLLSGDFRIVSLNQCHAARSVAPAAHKLTLVPIPPARVHALFAGLDALLQRMEQIADTEPASVGFLFGAFCLGELPMDFADGIVQRLLQLQFDDAHASSFSSAGRNFTGSSPPRFDLSCLLAGRPRL